MRQIKASKLKPGDVFTVSIINSNTPGSREKFTGITIHASPAQGITPYVEIAALSMKDVTDIPPDCREVMLKIRRIGVEADSRVHLAPAKDGAVIFRASIPIRYPEDNQVNFEADEDGKLPLMFNGAWVIDVDLETGKIIGWPTGTTAKIEAKVVDEGTYHLMDSYDEPIESIENNYVPDCLQIDDRGYGDYVFLTVLEDGTIFNWPKKDEVLRCFETSSY